MLEFELKCRQILFHIHARQEKEEYDEELGYLFAIGCNCCSYCWLRAKNGSNQSKHQHDNLEHHSSLVQLVFGFQVFNRKPHLMIRCGFFCAHFYQNQEPSLVAASALAIYNVGVRYPFNALRFVLS